MEIIMANDTIVDGSVFYGEIRARPMAALNANFRNVSGDFVVPTGYQMIFKKLEIFNYTAFSYTNEAGYFNGGVGIFKGTTPVDGFEDWFSLSGDGQFYYGDANFGGEFDLQKDILSDAANVDKWIELNIGGSVYDEGALSRTAQNSFIVKAGEAVCAGLLLNGASGSSPVVAMESSFRATFEMRNA